MNRQKITTSRRVGEVSSKYGYYPELFERDLEQHAAKSEALWKEFWAWMIERKVDPENLRYLFLRLWEEFLKWLPGLLECRQQLSFARYIT